MSGPLLEISGLGHRFGGLQAVKDFNLTLQGGELISIIGPNGAGKTTVFNLITGVYRPTEGSVSFEGQSIVGRPPSTICAMGIARTFQSIRLFKDISVLDNVRIAHYPRVEYNLISVMLRNSSFLARERRIINESRELLSVFNLSKYENELAKNLPYGDQRRLEIARAIATNPKLLLLDEPAAGMNPGEVGRLMELILFIRDRYNLTILLIEHQMRVVMGISERIKVLYFGETIAEGTPDEVKRNPKVLEAYLGKGAASR